MGLGGMTSQTYLGDAVSEDVEVCGFVGKKQEEHPTAGEVAYVECVYGEGSEDGYPRNLDIL